MKQLVALSIIGMSIMAGCQNQLGEDDIYEESGNTINVSERTDMYNKDGVRNDKNDKNSNFGYVRHQKSPIANDTNNQRHIGLNREELADAISTLSVQLPNIQDAATLVTDEEVLVAYKTDAKDRNNAADMVKKTAASAVPRYYHVYVSDDPNMIGQIENYSTLDSNSRNIDSIIDKTIREMLKSPQGRKLSDGENANGEGYGEMNEELDDDFKDNFDKVGNKR
ncbi:YhcN/YlaJ family sporulation lipoprotein [Metabacillus arenae]|uniref:YhcN/YlaJ family sporulation lipoprotein n=1 Tax=Metabacillus arenae TaxID=2771434 RepID=A0A926NGE8_9BACI|nr:YhcN/YlaJ family sporulation lipoprotein [Metabacillus arenae]MBD1380816.1 YhcN/YlaJ family sporulation lipoprotein [Metabacillus arenae]